MDEEGTVVVRFEELLKDANSFPYLALVAFDAGGVLRLLFLLLLLPLSTLLRRTISQTAGDKILTFAATTGVGLEKLQSSARAVLPKFFAEELRAQPWRPFNGFPDRLCVVSSFPRVLIEIFCKECLGAETVIGAELHSFVGFSTGLLLSKNNGKLPRFSLPRAVARRNLPKIVFHDGRLAQKPTPLTALLIILYLPLGFALAFIRIAAGSLLPMNLLRYIFPLLGVHITVEGHPPEARPNGGTLIVCNHRTLLDPVFLSAALRRPITAVTFSISRLSELLAPIRTVRLSRNRAEDAELMRRLLKEGDLVVCPEGTTCREPFVLRFSSLFAELAGEIAPVAVATRPGLFHGTTARGWKGMDPFFFFMNPRPKYEIKFLGKLSSEVGSCGGHDLANYTQSVIAAALGYECTDLTRRDKYRVLAGSDGGRDVKVKKEKMKDGSF
ncbi:glycerol-3-phosphate acyltransferase RAM2-like isoform X2 [Wolffia australiana]